MGRNLFRGAPDLSRIFEEAPLGVMIDFLSHPDLSEVLGDTGDQLRAIDDDARRESARQRLSTLTDDRVRLIESEACRIVAMADEKPDTMLLRLGENARFGAWNGLSEQRDALARSLWSYVHARALFENAERTMQVRVYRDHGKLYEAWSLDDRIPLSAVGVDPDRLAEEIAGRLHHEDGCTVEAIDLPPEEGESKEVLVAITFAGAYASQRTVRPDRTTAVFYYRPPDEVLLVYSPSKRKIEVCSRDATERRLIARIFASETLRHDVSNKPLMQKTYNLSRFRKSLLLPIPQNNAHRVNRVGVTEVQIALGDWSKKVSLSVTPEDDIDKVARQVFGEIIPASGGGYITRIGFHIDHVDRRGKKGVLKFTVFGRNKSNIQSERNPAKRELGYELLEAWGVLERIGDLTRHELENLQLELLSLYDLPEVGLKGAALEEMDIDTGRLVSAGYMKRKGWSDVILFEDEFFGDMLHDVERDGTRGEVTLTQFEDGSGPQLPEEAVAEYEVNLDYIRDEITQLVTPLGVRGRARPLADHLHHLGTARLGFADAPVYLARGLSDDKKLALVDRLLRGEAKPAKGIVFVPRRGRVSFLGSHVVLSIEDHLDQNTGQLDVDAVRIAYEADVDLARRGAAVHFRKQDATCAEITVPGQQRRIVVGEKRVLFFERLYMAHRDKEPGVKLEMLKAYAGFSSGMSQFFKEDWGGLEGRYIRRVQHGFWALSDGSTSV